jgi:alpha-beta hydrolase superfamily lysophospholipase
MTSTKPRDTAWNADEALEGFEALRIELPPDAEGSQHATLVRRRPSAPTRVVLYLHGFIDYFYQAHVAERFNQQGFAFYALDLRKHGRSLLPHQRPNFCRDLREYYPEITAAIDVIDAVEPGLPLLLYGHSTGGLTAALYTHEGDQRERIAALLLVSPFFDLNSGPPMHVVAAGLVRLGAIFPYLSLGHMLSPLYAQSIHRDFQGEWNFDLRWKPIEGFPTYIGWLRAIVLGQRRMRAGLQIDCPILLLHSARSGGGRQWNNDYRESDTVLNVAHMRRDASRLGSDITLSAIPGGLHDLTLSRPEVQTKLFQVLFDWIERRMPSSNPA